MADIVVSDLGKERRLRIRDSSPLFATLDATRSQERNEWLANYLTRRIGVLFACILDSAYRLDTVLSNPSPAGVSVVEYPLLRQLLEYAYKLVDLVQMEIDIAEREKRSIEYWKADYWQFDKINPQHQAPETAKYFAKWKPVLEEWYHEITGRANIHVPTVRDIFNRTGDVESWWPRDRNGNAVNPAYMTGYSIYSAVEHGNLWAVQRYGMNDPSEIVLDHQGLDHTSSHVVSLIAGTLLQLSYGCLHQFVTAFTNSGTMSRLESLLAVIRESLPAEAINGEV